MADMDLRGTDLAGMVFMDCNMSGIDLEGADMRHTSLCGSNLRGARLSGADMRYVDLRGADLSGADMRYVDLRGADTFEASMHEVNLEGADMRGVELQGLGMTQGLWIDTWIDKMHVHVCDGEPEIDTDLADGYCVGCVGRETMHYHDPDKYRWSKVELRRLMDRHKGSVTSM